MTTLQQAPLFANTAPAVCRDCRELSAGDGRCPGCSARREFRRLADDLAEAGSGDLLAELVGWLHSALVRPEVFESNPGRARMDAAFAWAVEDYELDRSRRPWSEAIRVVKDPRGGSAGSGWDRDDD